jgi:hypothetical protein
VAVVCRLSNSPPRLPRANEAFMIRSRSARFSSEASGGCPVVFARRTRNLPSWPAALAASAAAATCASLKPASSARLSTITADASTSLSTFWLKVVCSVASSVLSAFSFSLSASDSVAPARTKSLW